MYVREISDGLYTAFTYLLHKARTLDGAGTPIQRPCVLMQCAQWCHTQPPQSFRKEGAWPTATLRPRLFGHCHPWVNVAAPRHETPCRIPACCSIVI